MLATGCDAWTKAKGTPLRKRLIRVRPDSKLPYKCRISPDTSAIPAAIKGAAGLATA
jgi:hypothetical protein